jgi:Flp pilus assembly protein TadD
MSTGRRGFAHTVSVVARRRERTLARLRAGALLFLVIICGRAGLCASPQQTDAEAREDRGLALAHAGNLPGAESELRSAVALAPNNPEFLTNLATVLAMEKKLEDSTTVFQRALKFEPGNLTARRYLAANLWQLDRYAEAKQNLELILKQKPNDDPSRLLLGMVAENMKDYSTAVRMLSSVPAEVQKQPESIGALANSYYHLGKMEEARRTLEEMKDHPAGARAVLLGARIADESTDYDTAEQLLNSIASSYSDRADWGYRLAAVQYHAGKFHQSEETLLRLLRSRSGNGQIFNLLGWCYQKENRSQEAMRAFENGIGAEPSYESNYLDLQKMLLRNNRLTVALEIAKKTTDALPKSAAALEMRGSIEIEASQFSNAVRSYRRAKELDPRSAEATLGLADAEFAADMKKDAINAFTVGIEQFPKDGRFPLHYALVLLKESETGDPQAGAHAEELLKSALKLDPTLAEAHYQLGELALKNGRSADALREYGAAAKLDPESAKVHFGLSKAYRRLGKSAEASREAELFQKLQQADPQSRTTRNFAETSKN